MKMTNSLLFFVEEKKQFFNIEAWDMKTLLERVTEISLSCVTVKSWAGREQPSTETGGSKDVKGCQENIVSMFDSRDSTIIFYNHFLFVEDVDRRKKKEMTGRPGRQLKFHLLFSPIESTSDRLSPPVHSTGIFCSSPLDPSTVSWRLATKSNQVFQTVWNPSDFFPTHF